MLHPPTTVIPLSRAFMISLWATAGDWWKTPSMIPIISAPSFIAFKTSPLLTGGRNSASIIVFASSSNMDNPRKIIIFSVISSTCSFLFLILKSVNWFLSIKFYQVALFYHTPKPGFQVFPHLGSIVPPLE